MTTSAFVGRFLTEQKPNRRSVTFIPVEGIPALKEPGVYIAVMSQPNRFRHEYQTTYYYVSDLGLHVRQYAGKGADAFVSSLTNGKAVSPASRFPGSVPTARSSAAPKPTATVAPTSPSGRRTPSVVMAKKGEQLSLIALKEPALDLAEFDIGGLTSAPVRLFAYSGRNLYRPGEKFDVSVMARDADGRSRCRRSRCRLIAAPPRRQGAMDRHLGAGREVRRLLPPRHRTAGRCRHRLLGTSNCAPTRRPRSPAR
jgi:uncharacterized protein YfaS (alpha-2-macroglobulin family)